MPCQSSVPLYSLLHLGSAYSLHFCFSEAALAICLPQTSNAQGVECWLQVLSDPRQKRFFKSKDMRDLFTLGDEYANATETSEIFASVNGEVTATLAAEQATLPELNHAEGTLPHS